MTWACQEKMQRKVAEKARHASMLHASTILEVRGQTLIAKLWIHCVRAVAAGARSCIGNM